MRLNLSVGNIDPDLAEVFGGALDLLYVVIRSEALDALGGGDSIWPVQTGLSKASFDAIVRPPVVSITNATTYAEDVEERTGAAATTLISHFEGASMVAAAEKVLGPYLEGK